MPQPITAAQVAAAGAMLKANDLSDVASVAQSRTNLGLGTAAVQNVGAFDAAGTAVTAAAAAQAAAIAASMPLNVVENTQADDYTLVLTDSGRLVTMSKGTATNLTVPLNATVAFPVGTQVFVEQIGAGQVTVVATGGVTINASPGLKLIGQWRMASLIKSATDTWDLVGALSA